MYLELAFVRRGSRGKRPIWQKGKFFIDLRVLPSTIACAQSFGLNLYGIFLLTTSHLYFHLLLSLRAYRDGDSLLA